MSYFKRIFLMSACVLFVSHAAIAQDDLRRTADPITEVIRMEEYQTPERCIIESAATKQVCYWGIETYQTINLGDRNGQYAYRWYNDDVNTSFVDPDFRQCRLTDAELCLEYRDVDFYDQPATNAEIDVVQFGPYAIDVLKGKNNEERTACWDVRSQILNNSASAIPFVIDVDATHDRYYWALGTRKATLTTSWQCQ